MTEPSDILDSIRRSPNGLAMRELLELHPDTARRTAQRWVKQLIEEGEVVPVGRGAARHYVAAGREPETGPDHELSDLETRLSKEAEEILEYVRRPIAGRNPVGYQRDFIDSYEPGITYYLPEPLRRRLRRIGSTGADQMPAGTYGRGILDRLLIDLSWASSHLEGNTYSHLDTRELIEHGKVAEGRDAAETQMILNHKAAIEMLVDNADAVGFDRYTILNLHSLLSENLLPNPADEGRIRQHAVAIGKSVYTPLAVPSLLDELFDVALAKADAIDDPFEQSFFALVHLPYLQPFADVNKRTSRLAANIPLIRENLVPLTFLDVPRKAYTAALLGVYELTRVDVLRDLFAWAYERSAQQYVAVTETLAEPDPTRLAYRDLIRATVRRVVTTPEREPPELIAEDVADVPDDDRESVRATISDELERLHEGVLARYGLRPSQYMQWRERGYDPFEDPEPGTPLDE